MTKIKSINILLLSAVVALSSCIKNDIPYPTIAMDILSLTVEGTSGEVKIDPLNRTVEIPLAETTDIRHVKITGVTYTEDATASADIVGEHDMRYPLYVTLSLYQDYEWTITATQSLDRRFTVAGQIGATEWNDARYEAKVYRRADFGRDTVTITSLSFGPRPEYVPDMDTPLVRNFGDARGQVTTKVSCFNGRYYEDWLLTVELKDIEVDITMAAAGANVIWLEALGVDGARTGFRYRVKGETEWQEAEQDWYTSTGGTIAAALRHLAPQTEYEVVAYAVTDDKSMESSIVSITTSETFTLPNGNFDEWIKDNNVWYPGSTVLDSWWGTGNPASKIANINLTEPFSGTLPDGATGECAQLKSQKVSVFGIGKFAAGNMFAGEFAGIKGTDGLVNFGRPYTLRPTALRGWVKYQQGVIDCVPGNPNSSVPGLGANDEGLIYIAVGDWDYQTYGGTPDCPVQVDTRNEASFFNSANAGIIAYGEQKYTASTDDWVEFEIPLEYRSFDRVPTHIIITCTGSRFGDYFVGSSSTIMWIDGFELLYDYE